MPAVLNFYSGALKLQREKEKTKAERKTQKKREKKEKKREKEEKNQDHAKTARVEKSHKGEKSWLDLERMYNQKKKEDEAEPLERSGLTEEHEQPFCSNNPSSSSDSMQISNKRKRHTLPSNGYSSHGNILRIRLPLQKHKESVPSVGKKAICSTDGSIDLLAKESDLSVGKKITCSTSGRTKLPAAYVTPPGAKQVELCSTSGRRDVGLQMRPIGREKESSHSISGKIDIFPQDDIPTPSGSTPFEKELWRVKSLYKDIIRDWVPPPLHPDVDDDQEWLFGRKNEERQMMKRPKASSSDISCCNALWPHAQYLAEADMYALPFTVPF